jgi:prepilin-type N-terminal cleavage/methylation domain-containing protein
MASNFKFKLLSHLTNKKAEKGFTLIELLVVVIIIGVLAAIALPNLLNQVGKARNAEGRNGVGALNRAQQVYRTENRTFGSDISVLDTKVAQGDYFDFASGFTDETATSTATAISADADNTLSLITGTVTYNPADGTFTTDIADTP